MRPRTGGLWIALGVAAAVWPAWGQEPDEAHVPVYIEDSPAAMELIDEAAAKQEEGLLGEAAATLQQVIERYPTKLIALDRPLYTDVRLWVERRLREQPELLDAYRDRFDATAARAVEQAWADDDPDAALAEALELYAMTRPGLDAGLALAGRAVERADAAAAMSALGRIEQHPDLDAVEGTRRRYHELAALAALLSGDEALLERHRGALARSADGTQRIDSLMNRWRVPTPARRAAPADAGRRPPPMDEPLWSAVVAEPDPAEARFGGRARGAVRYPLVPAVAGETLYLNTGDEVHAADRISGRTLWRFKLEQIVPPREPPILGRNPRSASDRRGVLVDGAALYAVMGWPPGWIGRVPEPEPTTHLLCLDALTGGLRWQTDPGQLAPALARAHFQGTPVLSYDRLFVLARRSQVSGFQDTFVVAVDARSGELLWRRHLASVVTTNRNAAPPVSEFRLDRGRLYVSDNLGAVACLDVRRGAVRWLRLLVDPADMSQRGVNTTRQTVGRLVSAPLRVSAGLIVPPTQATSESVLLDPDTGELRRKLDGADWDQVQILARADGGVLAVGRQVALLDDQTLEPRWTTRLRQDTDGLLHAEPAVTRRYAVLASPDRLFVVSLEDGSLLTEMAVSEGGHALALADQVLIAGKTRVRSYMGWSEAAGALQRQMVAAAAAPEPDVGPALALAHLAVQGDRPEDVLRAADSAISLWRRYADEPARDPAMADDLQARVFEQLLAYARPTAGARASLRASLLDRLARITADPAQEVAYHLARGDLLAETERPTSAAEHYQAVLATPELAGQTVVEPLAIRPAHVAAELRLRALVAEHGPQVYGPYAERAERRLLELRGGGTATAERWIEMARQYPLAPASIEALIEAARASLEANDAASARRALAIALHREPGPELGETVIGELATLLIDLGRGDRALALLARVERDRPEWAPPWRGEPTPFDAWQAAADATVGQHPTLPRFATPPAAATVRRGQLLEPFHDAAANTHDTGSTAGLLIREEAALRLITAKRPRWRVAWSNPNTVVVDGGLEHVTLWSPGAAALTSLDAQTGRVRWSLDDAQASLAELGDESVREALRNPEQQEFLEFVGVNDIRRIRRMQNAATVRHERFVLARDTMYLVIGDASGRVMALDRVHGEVLWRVMTPIERLTQVAMSNGRVVIAGMTDTQTDSPSGALLMMDARTGEALGSTIELRDLPQWLGFAGRDRMVVAVTDELTAYDPGDARVLWRTSVGGTTLTGQAWASSRAVIAAANSGDLLVLDAEDGSIMGQRTLGASRQLRRDRVRRTAEGWLVVTDQGAFALGPGGEVRWRDAIEFDGDQVVASALTRDALIVAVRPSTMVDLDPAAAVDLPEPALRPAQDGTLTLYWLDRASGRLTASCRLESVPFAADEPLRMQAAENRLAISGDEVTLIVTDAEAEGVAIRAVDSVSGVAVARPRR